MPRHANSSPHTDPNYAFTTLLCHALGHPLGIYVRDQGRDMRTFIQAFHRARATSPAFAAIKFRPSPEDPEHELWVLNVPAEENSSEKPRSP